MSTIEEKSLKVIVFSGKQDDWRFWEVKFLARARRKGFRELLLGKLTIPIDTEVLNDTVPAEKIKIDIRDANELAFEELVLSIDTSQPEGRVAFQSICSCRTTDYKNGNAAVAWKSLSDKYAPKIAPMKLELKFEFQRMKLRDASEDPDVWISQLEDLRGRLKDMNAPISDDDFFVHILNNLPPEYEVQVSKLEERFGSTTNPLTVQDLRTELNLKYARLKRMSAEKTETDQALAAFRRFKGKCTNCGKMGHKASECCSRTKKTNGTPNDNKPSENSKHNENKPKRDTSNIKCFGCGKMGHFQNRCPENEENQPKKKSSQKGADTVLMAISSWMKSDNSLWIADSGASTHITTSDIGLFDTKTVNDPVQVGDGKFVYATKVGKLTVEYTNSQGEKARIMLENVKYIPGFSSNLFSLTAALAKNCMIYNKGRAIVVQKDQVRIEFNEEIKTQNGYVCGARLIVECNDQALIMPAGNKKCDVQLAHHLLGHVCEATVRESAKFYGWTLKNKMENCDSCAMAKS